MIKEQISYRSGSLHFVNPGAPSVTQIICKLNKSDAKKLLERMCEVTEDYASSVRYSKGLGGGSSANVQTMLDNGFTMVVQGKEEFIIGKVLDEGMEVTVLHYIKDGKSIKQMYLSPNIHNRISNGEYIREVMKSL